MQTQDIEDLTAHFLEAPRLTYSISYPAYKEPTQILSRLPCDLSSNQESSFSSDTVNNKEVSSPPKNKRHDRERHSEL
jgi:hypothetical protein